MNVVRPEQVQRDQADQQSLTDAQRDACLEAIDENGFCILPCWLPDDIIARASQYIDAYCSDTSKYAAPKSSYSADDPRITGGNRLTETNIVEADKVFCDMLTYKPAMQLCYDLFGPLFRLGQDKWTRKYKQQVRAERGHKHNLLLLHQMFHLTNFMFPAKGLSTWTGR